MGASYCRNTPENAVERDSTPCRGKSEGFDGAGIYCFSRRWYDMLRSKPCAAGQNLFQYKRSVSYEF